MEIKPIDLEEIATVMRRSIYNAYSNTLIGNAPQRVTDAYDRMTNPKIGDWVIEASTVYGFRHNPSSPLDGVGILENVAHEKVDFGDPEFVWDEKEEGRPHPTEKVHYIRTMDGRLFRWTNAMIVAAPAELKGPL